MIDPPPVEEFLAASADKPAHPLMSTLEPYLNQPGMALDLGCGAGANAKFLADRGWHVLAMDAAPAAIALAQRVNAHPAIEWLVGDFREAKLPMADLTLAFFSLFFVPPDEFESAWERIAASVRPGGIFAGQFLGPRDDWASPMRSTQSAEQVHEMLRGWTLLHTDEVERDGKDVTGRSKHWHVTHVIARRS